MSFDGGSGLLGMRMTTEVKSVTNQVADQDRALTFSPEVLARELRTDAEAAHARLCESAPTEKEPDG